MKTGLFFISLITGLLINFKVQAKCKTNWRNTSENKINGGQLQNNKNNNLLLLFLHILFMMIQACNQLIQQNSNRTTSIFLNELSFSFQKGLTFWLSLMISIHLSYHIYDKNISPENKIQDLLSYTAMGRTYGAFETFIPPQKLLNINHNQYNLYTIVMWRSLASLIRPINSVTSCKLVKYYFNNYAQLQFKKHPHQKTQQQYQSYFENSLDTLGQLCRKIIQQMGQRRKDINQHELLIKEYLDIHYTNQNAKRPEDILMLLVAINMIGHYRLMHYRNLLIEHLFRCDREEIIKMDQITLTCFIEATTHYLKTVYEKSKLASTKYHFFDILKDNFDNIKETDYILILKVLCQDDRNKIAYLSIVKILQQKLTEIFKKVENKEPLSEGATKLLRIFRFNQSIEYLANVYNCDEEHAEYLFKYINNKILPQLFTKETLNIDDINYIYRFYPERQKSKEGVYYKSMILDRIISLFQQKDLVTSLAFSKGYFLCSSIIHNKFYSHWMNLTFCQIDDWIFLEKSQLLEPPELGSFFWQLYSKNPAALNNNQIARNTIKDCYPSRYQQTSKLYEKETREPFYQSQMKIRADLALQSLNLTFKKEVNISGRFIDFLIDDSIALQIDGLIHYQTRYFQINDNTAYRNLHILLAGYRLITISIHEYNKNREIHQLGALIKQKLEILNQQNCAAVL